MDFLSAQEILILTEAHHSCRLRKSADRIKAVLLLNDGLTYSQVSKILMLDENTIRRYFKRFKKTGVDGLFENNYFGSVSFLSHAQQDELTVYLREVTFQSVKEVVGYVFSKYEMSYSLAGMTHLLHRMGFVYKKTKSVPSKFDPKKQEIFIKEYEELKASKSEQDKIYFLDATHPQHNNMPFYGWIYKGEIKTIKSNSGRERLNLNGALSLEDLDITVLEEKTINSQSMMRLLSELERKQPVGKIHCILDNARYNHSLELKEFLMTHGRIRFKYLPSYSPNLNIIERLWKYFKSKQLTNHYYETFKEFKENSLVFFQDIEDHKQELRTLLTDSFQTLPP